jgi:uncharacterized membrane protein
MLERHTNSMWKKILNILKNPLFILSLILILGLVLRLLDINKTSFWYDEAFTGDVLKLSWKDMFAVIASDKVHPPLFYVLIRCWSILFGVTQFSLRSFSVFFGLCGIGLSYFIGKSLFNKGKYPVIGIILALVVAISPFFVTYSIEARAYSLLAFLALGLAYATIKLLDSDNGKERTKYLITSICLALILLGTHYLQIVYIIAIVCTALIYKFVFTKKGVNKRWLYVCLGIILLVSLSLTFLPIKAFVNSLGISGMWWIPDIKLVELLRIYYSYFLGVVRYMQGVPPVRELIINTLVLIWGGILFGIHVIGYIWTLISKKIDIDEKRKITFFFVLPIITFFGFYILSAIGFNSFVERYTIAGGLLLIISFWMIISTVLKKWWTFIPIAIYIAVICMLKPMQTLVDYRETAKSLDSLNNVTRYVFAEPVDFINTQFYMTHTSVYYYYELDGEFKDWALLMKDQGLKIEDIEKGDALVVPNYEIEKFTKLGLTTVSNVGNDFTVMSK